MHIYIYICVYPSHARTQTCTRTQKHAHTRTQEDDDEDDDESDSDEDENESDGGFSGEEDDDDEEDGGRNRGAHAQASLLSVAPNTTAEHREAVTPLPDAAGPVRRANRRAGQPRPRPDSFVTDLVSAATGYWGSHNARAIDALVRRHFLLIVAAADDAARVGRTQGMLVAVLAVLSSRVHSPAFDDKCRERLSFLHASVILPFVQVDGPAQLCVLLLRVAKEGEHVNATTGPLGWTAWAARCLRAAVLAVKATAAVVCYEAGVGYSRFLDLFGLGGNISYYVKARERDLSFDMLGILVALSHFLRKRVVCVTHTLGSNVQIPLKLRIMSTEAKAALRHSVRQLLRPGPDAGADVSRRKPKTSCLMVEGTQHLSTAGIGPGSQKAAGPAGQLATMVAAVNLNDASNGSGSDLEAAFERAVTAAAAQLEDAPAHIARVTGAVLSREALNLVRTDPTSASKHIGRLVAASLLRDVPGADVLCTSLESMVTRCIVPVTVPLPADLPTTLGGLEIEFERLASFGALLQAIRDTGGALRDPPPDTLPPNAQVARLLDELAIKGATPRPLYGTEVWVYLIVVRDEAGEVVFIYIGSTNSLWRRFARDRTDALQDPTGKSDGDAATRAIRNCRDTGKPHTIDVTTVSFVVPEGEIPVLGGGKGLMLYVEACGILEGMKSSKCVNVRSVTLTASGGFSSEDAREAGKPSRADPPPRVRVRVVCVCACLARVCVCVFVCVFKHIHT